MGCAFSAVKEDMLDQSLQSLEPLSSWEMTAAHVMQEAAHNMGPIAPTRLSHERHLFALDRFLTKVDRAPHRFSQKVDRYRAAMEVAEPKEDAGTMVSVQF